MSDYIKKRYSSSKNGKIDLAIPFIERGIELLNGKGSLGYIVQKRFFKTEYGKGIRKLLSEKRLLRSIYDFAETNLFEDRITYVAIIACDKSTVSDKSINYTNSSDGKSVAISKETITETPWSFENHQTNALRLRLAEELGTLGEVCNIKVGVQVLWDKAYHIEVDHVDDDYIYGRTALCGDLRIERGACRMLICNEHFTPLSVREGTTYILFPYEVENGTVLDMKFSDYQSRFPLAGRYLRENRAQIEANVQTMPTRSPALDPNENWHLYTRANNHNAVYKKLCVPMTSQNPQAAVVMQEDAYCDNANMFFIQIPDATDDKLYAMAAVINSTPFAFFAKSIANPQQGGFYKFNKQFLNPVPFPRSQFLLFGEGITKLASVARHIEEVNSAVAANNSSAHRLYPLLNKLWNEVDQLCCNLYCLNEGEKTLIMSNPRIDHHYE